MLKSKRLYNKNILQFIKKIFLKISLINVSIIHFNYYCIQIYFHIECKLYENVFCDLKKYIIIIIL